MEMSSWGRIGHGHYCMFSFGNVYSHIDKKVNCADSFFAFKKGDTVNFEYDRNKGKFKITK